MRTATPRFSFYTLCQDSFIFITDLLQTSTGNMICPITNRTVYNRNQFSGLCTTSVKGILVFLFIQSIGPSTDTKPAFLLEKIKEYNLSHQFLCKLCRSEVMLFSFNTEVLNRFKLFTQLVEFLTIQIEKLICYFFHTKCFFQIIQRRMLRICSAVSDETLKTADCRMARLISTNKIGISFCWSNILSSFQSSILDFHFIIETNQRKPPFGLTFGIKGNKSSIGITILDQLFGIASLEFSTYPAFFNCTAIMMIFLLSGV